MKFEIDVPDENWEYIDPDALAVAINTIISELVAQLKEQEERWINGDGVGEPVGIIEMKSA